MDTFQRISDYRDSAQRLSKVRARYEEVLQQEKEAEVLRIEEERCTARGKRKKAAKKIGAIVALVAVVMVVYQIIIKDMLAYQKADRLAQQGEYAEAIAAFEALGDYKDSAEQIKAVKYAWAQEKEANENYSGAAELYHELGDYQDSSERAAQAEKTAENEENYQLAMDYLEEAEQTKRDAQGKNGYPRQVVSYVSSICNARDQLIALGDYKDAAKYVKHFVWRQTGIGSRTSPSRQEFYQYDDGYLCGIRQSDGYAGYTWSADHRSVTRLEYGRQTLRYDEQGNLIRITAEGTTNTYTYDFNEDGSIAHRYEKYVDGDRTTDGTTEYKYDEEGRLTETMEERTSDYDRDYGKVPGRITTSVYNYNSEGQLFTVERTIVRYDADDTKTSKLIDTYGWVYAPNATE